MGRIAQAILGHPALYIASQHVMLAVGPRYDCLTELDVRPGHKLLDVGCGPAYYLDKLPQGVEYHGFDTEPRYIAWARQRFGRDGVTFHDGMYTDEERQRLPRFDRVMLMGLLHHLDDNESHELLRLVVRSLAPGGLVVTLDTCFDPELNALQTLMAKNDRGKHVRETSAFKALASQHFGQVTGRLMRNWLAMKLVDPLGHADTPAGPGAELRA